MTVADCQELLNIATRDKSSLEFRKTGLERQLDSSSTNSVEIEAELAAVTAEVNIYEQIIASLPEGTIKEENKVKLTKAQYKKFTLEQRRGELWHAILAAKAV